jgi:hypothetical protein
MPRGMTLHMADLETLKRYTRWVAGWVLFGILFAAAISNTPYGRDDSDVQGWGGGRSGMRPMTDALTGCQYLGLSDGGITPRLDADGGHLGCRHG